MNDFKVGDRVEYVGDSEDIKAYGPLTVSGEHGMTGRISVEEVSWAAIIPENLRLVTPTPDVLTIARAELPEVVEKGDWVTFEETGHYVCGIHASAAVVAPTLRRQALELLAAIDYLEAREKEADAAREKAEQDAADQHAAILNKRRDELAREVAKAAGWNDWQSARYHSHQAETQMAIEMHIKLEGQVKK